MYNDSSDVRQITRLAIQLHDGLIYSAPITGVKDYGLNVVRILQIADFIPSFPTKCLTRNKISGVYLQAPPGNTDGWFVTSVDTYTGHCGEVFLPLSTNFPNFDKWVDYDDGVDYSYNTRLL